MNSHEIYFDAHTTTWLSKGFEVKGKLLRAVASGDTVSIQQHAADYTSALIGLLGANLEYAKDTAFFIFAQVSAAGTINGLADWEAFKLKQGYYYAVDKTESITEILGFIRNFIVEFTEAVHRSKVERGYSPIIRKVCEFVYLNLREKITIEMIATNLHFSRSYVSHKFKEEVGISIMDYVIQLRIEEAKHMLNQHATTVTVAQELGFSSQSHFNRVFKEKVGISPGKWCKIHGTDVKT